MPHLRVTCCLPLLLVASCTTFKPRPESDTAVDVEIGHVDHYSSSNQKYYRYICEEQKEKSITYRLSQAQLKTIGQIAVRTDFFHLPKQIPSVPDENGRITVTAPCFTNALTIYHAGNLHRVSWSCDDIKNGEQPAQVREIFNFVIDSLKQAEIKLPESGCRFH